MNRWRVLILLALLLCGRSASADEMAAERILSFADHLFARGDYYRAITEYERVLFFYPDHPLARTARLQIANCYLQGGRLDQASERFRALTEGFPDDEVGRKALFLLGEAEYQKREYSRAAEIFTLYIEHYPGDARVDAARIKTGWSYLRQGRWRQATEEFQKLPPDSPLYAQAEGMIEASRLYPDIPKKSPALAGGLSAILPGAGQLYIKRPGDALVSFLLNGAFIWATVEAFQNDNKVSGGILLFFEAGWYSGNIYNAVNGAHKYNRRSEQQFMDSLQGKYSLSYFPAGKGNGMIGLTMRF
jgi:outer membrane protein assembly factor BamD (BamD/ComL family)/TM2 domain-containing membrane protein YozV